ncbi:MAG TPA: GAF domain-containing protein [Thermoplasmata archaeon]
MSTHIDKETLLSVLQDGVFVCSKEGDLIYANDAMAAAMGCSIEEILRKNIVKDLVDRNLEWRALISLLDQGTTISDYEMKFRRPDSTKFCAAVSASLLKAPAGGMVGVLGALRDISNRKAVENELREKAFSTGIVNKIAKLAATSTDVRTQFMVGMCDELQKLLNFDLVCLSLSEDKGRQVEVVTSVPANSCTTKSSGQVAIGGSIVEDLRFGKSAIVIEQNLELKDFSEFSVIDASKCMSMLAVPLRSRGRVLGALSLFSSRPSEYSWSTAETLQMVADQIAGMIDGITLLSYLESKIRLQAALVKTGVEIQKNIGTEQIYSVIASNIAEVITYTELALYLVDWTKGMIRPAYATGSWKEEMMASNGTIDEGIVGSVARSGKAEAIDDVDVDPRVCGIAGVPDEHNSMLALPLVGSEGVLGVIELYRPSGKIFSAGELEAGQLFAQQASVAIENAQLVSKLRDIRKEIEMMNDLMFHDINNFNFASSNYIDMVVRMDKLMPEDKAHLEKALQLIRQTSTLIEKVKKLAKIGGMTPKELGPVDLTTAIRKTVSGLENSFPGRSVSVSVNVPEGCYVTANALVEELVANILSNSVKYDPHDEVEIDVDCSRTSESGKPYWKLCITDRGHGISDEQKPLLFQKYVRLRADAKTPGTGLGLSICKALVDKFGGRIWVEDRVPGKSELGAKFCVTLQLAKGPNP